MNDEVEKDSDSAPMERAEKLSTPHLRRENGLTKPKIISSELLFEGKVEILISHNKQIYRLRQTRNGKLILIK